MNILFVTNYFGLHGSSFDLILFAKEFRKIGHNVFFVGGDGFLRERFEDAADDIHVIANRKYYPSVFKIILLRRLIRKWRIDAVIGVGKFIALECQIASLLFTSRMPISMMNFSPRRHHWRTHPKWHIPRTGLMTVNCLYYKDRTVEAYNWSAERIHLLSARYEVPEKIQESSDPKNKKNHVLFIRRMDSPKYLSIIRSLEQLGQWGVWDSWTMRVIGGGTHEDRVKEKIDEIKANCPDADIAFLGKQRDVISLMRQADIVVGSERVAVEAMAEGCLVLLATDDGLIDLISPETIATYAYDNFFGYNYPILPSDEIKIRVFDALSNPQKRDHIRTGNHRYIKIHLDVVQGRDILLSLIDFTNNNRPMLAEVCTGLFRIIGSWMLVYLYLFRDKLFRSR